MKHVKLKILAVIWLSIIVLEGVFTIILNIAIPAYFKNMAESALKYEYEYFTKLDKINKYFGVNDESEVSDDLLGEYNAELKAVEYEEQPMSNDIRYAPLEEMAVVGGSNEAKKQNGVKVSSKSVSEQIAGYCRANNFEYGKTGEFRTSSADCVFLVYNSNPSSDEPANTFVMFINVQPILEYVGTMNWVLASAFVSVAAIMTVIGSILGDRIRDTQLTQQRFFQKRRVLPGEMLLQKARTCIRLFTRKLHRVDFAQAEHSACRQPPRPAHQHIAPVLLIFLHDDGLKQTMPGDRLRQHWQRGILPKTRRNHAAVDFIHWQAHCPQCFFLRTNSLSALQKPFPLDVLCQGVYAAGEAFDDDPFRYV